MKKLFALFLAAALVLAFSSCGSKTDDAAASSAEVPAVEDSTTPAPEVSVMWADYQNYLIEKAGGSAPDPVAFAEQVNAMAGWDDVDETQPPWNKLFTTVGLSTWAEFQAGIVKEAQVTGTASGESAGASSDTTAASGEPEASGELSSAGAAPVAPTTPVSDEWAAYLDYAAEQIRAQEDPSFVDQAIATLYNESNESDPNGWPFDMFVGNRGLFMSYEDFIRN